MNNACMNTFQRETSCKMDFGKASSTRTKGKGIYNKPVEKSDSKKCLDEPCTSENNSENDSKFSSVLEKFSQVEKEEITKGEEEKEGEERKKDIECEILDGEMQILSNNILVDNVIAKNEVLVEEQSKNISDLSIKEKELETEKVILLNDNNHQDSEDKSKIFEIFSTELTKDSNTLKDVKLSNINKEPDDTGGEVFKSTLEQSTLKKPTSEIFYNLNNEAITVSPKELGAVDNTDYKLTLEKFDNNKNSFSVTTSDNLDDNESIIKEVAFEKVDNEEEKTIKIETEKRETIKNNVFTKENKENKVVKLQSEYFADNAMNLSKEKNTNIKIDDSAAENSINDINYSKENGLDEFSIIQQMTKSITTGKFNNGNSITVKLKPEYLGEMTINIQNIEGKCIAKISADRDEIKNIIASRIGEITTLLSEKMIKIDQIIVDSLQQGTNENKNLGNESNNNNMFNMSDQNHGSEYNQNDKRNSFGFAKEDENMFESKSYETDQISSYRGINLYV